MTLKLRVEPVGIANALSAQRHASAQYHAVKVARSGDVPSITRARTCRGGS